MSSKKDCGTENASNSLVKTGSIHALLAFSRWREGKESEKLCSREVGKKSYESEEIRRHEKKWEVRIKEIV